MQHLETKSPQAGKQSAVLKMHWEQRQRLKEEMLQRREHLVAEVVLARLPLLLCALMRACTYTAAPSCPLSPRATQQLNKCGAPMQSIGSEVSDLEAWERRQVSLFRISCISKSYVET